MSKLTSLLLRERDGTHRQTEHMSGCDNCSELSYLAFKRTLPLTRICASIFGQFCIVFHACQTISPMKGSFYDSGEGYFATIWNGEQLWKALSGDTEYVRHYRPCCFCLQKIVKSVRCVGHPPSPTSNSLLVQSWPAILHSALYLRMGTPPLEAGSSNSTCAVLEYGSTWSIEGAEGTSREHTDGNTHISKHWSTTNYLTTYNQDTAKMTARQYRKENNEVGLCHQGNSYCTAQIVPQVEYVVDKLKYCKGEWCLHVCYVYWEYRTNDTCCSW